MIHTRGFHAFSAPLAFLLIVLIPAALFGDASARSLWRDIRQLVGNDAAFARIISLTESYPGQIQRLEVVDDDVIFWINEEPLYFCDGKMLSKRNLHQSSRYDPIFYSYPAGTLDMIPAPSEINRRSSDFLDLLCGNSEREIRADCRLVSFLNHKVFVHELCIDSLKKVEKEIQEAAADPMVQYFLDEMKVMYSFQRRTVAGMDVHSYHAYGLAIDLVPHSFKGKHVYWRWSAVLNKTWYEIPWHQTPLSMRWSPPQSVINAFERHGFIWGGKWSRFDTVHFEYRPEILKLREFALWMGLAPPDMFWADIPERRETEKRLP